MAETFEQYEKNKLKSRERPPVSGVESAISATETRLNAALDQTELIKGVAARVTDFVKAYEAEIAPELDYVQRTRETLMRRSRVMEEDLQRVVDVQDEQEKKWLLLDDLKVLLDLLPEGYKP